MAKAYKCDLCGKFIGCVKKVDGLDVKIGERRGEFTGTHSQMHEVHEICGDCYNKIMKVVVSLYIHGE